MKTFTIKLKALKAANGQKKFADQVYNNVKKHKYFITNLGKCTQVDARALPDSVF